MVSMSSLSLLELSIYAAIWLSSNIYCLIYLYTNQEKLIRYGYIYLDNLYELKPGFSFIRRFQDHTDIEFPMWHKHFFNCGTYLIMHFVFAELLRKFRLNNNLMPIYHALFSSCYIIYAFKFGMLAMFLAQPILLFLAFLLIGRHKSFLWLLSIVCMVFINIIKDSNKFYNLVIDDWGLTEVDSYLILVTLNWIQLRCVTACLDASSRYEQVMQNKADFFAKMLGHCLYFPTLFMGPNIMYANYEKSLDCKTHSDLKLRLANFARNMIFLLFYYFMISLYLHYIYFFAIQTRLKYMYMLPTVALYGGGLWMGLHFYMKYVVSYGTASAFASLDHIDAPPIPRCIFRVHLYSDMWKYFDVGLYRFLIEYIYKPVLIKLSLYTIRPILKTLFASLLCFGFILLWHGWTKPVVLWIALNYTGIVIEKVSEELAKTDLYKRFRFEILKTEQNHDRFRAFICLPLLIMSAFSNIFLFTDYEIGMVYIRRFFSDSFLHILCVCFSLYSGANVAIALRNYGSRKFCEVTKVQVVTVDAKVD